MRALLGFVLAITLLAGIAFIGVLVEELQYINGHPYQYGPAKVIAWAAGAGAALAVAVALLVVANLRASR